MSHLQDVNMTYWEHFRLGMRMNLYCLLAFVYGIIHTIFPNLYPFKGYKYILKIHSNINDLYKK